MTVKRKEFGYHSRDSGDEWWFYLCKDTDGGELFVMIEKESREGKSERRIGLAEYLTSGERGRGKLMDLIETLID